jgi:hypothetical protein
VKTNKFSGSMKCGDFLTKSLALASHFLPRKGSVVSTSSVFPNQGSAEQRQGFREKSWNK